MLLADILRVFQISDRSGNFENPIVRTRRKAEAVGDQFQHPVAGGVQLAVFLDEAGCHLGVAVDFGSFVAFQLQFTRAFHPPGDGGGTFRFAPVGEVAVFYGRYFDMDVDAVKERAGDARPVTVDTDRSAGAGVGRVGKIAAGAGVC